MKFVIKLFPEITIKSKPVRKQLVSRLRDNIKKILLREHDAIAVISQWDLIEVRLDKVDLADGEKAELVRRVADLLQRIPGIANILLVNAYPLESFEQVARLAVEAYRDQIAGKSFVVRVKRAGKHTFTSTELERFVGGALLKAVPETRVDLHRPDVVVKLEVRHQEVQMIQARHEGLGGFPLGAQEPVLSLISGGFDSVVASYLTMKRGLKTHFCFFNLGGSAHEIGVKQVALYLWERYGSSHRVKFVTVPFEPVVAEILTKVHHSQMGVVLKRQMLRAASRVAEELKVHALVTGESVAQVSSQTLPNLSVIDRATDTLVLRPLITMDKLDIIRLAAHIGAEEFAANMPEYCGVISDRPTTRAKLGRVEAEEANMDPQVLERVIAERKIINVDEILSTSSVAGVVEVVHTPAVDDVVVDIRHPDEQQKKPLVLTNNEVLNIPFYELISHTHVFDDGRRYLLYCQKGTMSQLHASHLKSLGKNNVLVYHES